VAQAAVVGELLGACRRLAVADLAVAVEARGVVLRNVVRVDEVGLLEARQLLFLIVAGIAPVLLDLPLALDRVLMACIAGHLRGALHELLVVVGDVAHLDLARGKFVAPQAPDMRLIGGILVLLEMTQVAGVVGDFDMLPTDGDLRMA
jgi:hypothetical protein